MLMMGRRTLGHSFLWISIGPNNGKTAKVSEIIGMTSTLAEED